MLLRMVCVKLLKFSIMFELRVMLISFVRSLKLIVDLGMFEGFGGLGVVVFLCWSGGIGRYVGFRFLCFVV